MFHQWMFVHFTSVFLNVFCLCGVWEDFWEDKIVARECKQDRRHTHSAVVKQNAKHCSWTHSITPFASSMETDRRIDRLSVCKGALFSAIPPLPPLCLGYPFIDGWKRMSDLKWRSRSATLTYSHWWVNLVNLDRKMHWVCLSPTLMSRNHNVGVTIQRTVTIVTKIVCLHSVWVNQINVSDCAGQTTFESDQ